MMKLRILIPIILMFVTFQSVFPQSPKTIPEGSNYTKTSTYEEVIQFLNSLKKRHPESMALSYFATTTEGRKIPLVILSEEGITRPGEAGVFNKPPVLIMANIHAGEVEGKEACQMLIRDILENGRGDLLKNQTVLIIPIFNCDGNEKMTAFNRRDNGPEIAGERQNGQGYDLNRDYIKLESPEVRGLVTRIFNKWDPVLFVDMHTTNGSLHQEPVTYAPNMAPEGDKTLVDYMWKKALPEMDRILLKKYKVDSIPYGNFIKRDDPGKGWGNNTAEGRFGTCYYGLRNRFSILNENYSHADFKTRVTGSYGFIKSILEYTSKHMEEMVKLIREADLRAIQKVKNGPFPVKFKNVKTYDFVIKSYVFKKIKILDSERQRYPKRWYGDYRVAKTDQLKNYKTTLMASFETLEKVNLTEGYILLPSQKEAARHLKMHGIYVQEIKEPSTQKVYRYQIKALESIKIPYQGHFLHRKIEFDEKMEEMEIPAGSYFVTLSQPLSRLAAYMLEPKSRDGLLVWNFFDRVIVRQWRGFAHYPVYKTIDTPRVVMEKF